VRVAPSYAAFCDTTFSWDESVRGGKADVPRLLAACSALSGGHRLAVIAVDMPLATGPIRGRRVADNQVSKQFGARKCSVHSPTIERPGDVGAQLCEDFSRAGFPLALEIGSNIPALLEVYPHVALLKLTGATERLPYKVSKSGSYWSKGFPATERKQRLLAQWTAILGHLEHEIDGIEIPLPRDPEQYTFQALKRYEDAIDGLVCAWMATRYLADDAIPLGDETGAIWIPAGL
jgi:predicted RNase H-like nuclease